MEDNLLTLIDRCIELDNKVLQNPQDASLAEQLAAAHLDLSAGMNEADDSQINTLDTTEEMKKQIISEKQLLPVLGAKGDYEIVTLLTTFTCFIMSRRDGEKMHSGKYMSDVKKIHESVNAFYGKDPKTAKSCS